MSFAKNLKEARLKAKLSQKELANISGVSQQAISVIEKGERSPSEATMILLAYALGCTITDLMAPHPKEEKPAPTNGSELTPEGIRIAEKIDRLSAESRRELEKYVDYLVAQARRDT